MYEIPGPIENAMQNNPVLSFRKKNQSKNFDLYQTLEINQTNLIYFKNLKLIH